jgi:hypothetical protein
MGNLDSFTLAVLGSALVVIVVFGLLMVVDKGKPSAPPANVPAAKVAPAKVAGKR